MSATGSCPRNRTSRSRLSLDGLYSAVMLLYVVRLYQEGRRLSEAELRT